MEMNQLDFNTILNDEEKILDNIMVNHTSLKKAVSEKNWEDLNKIIVEMNTLSTCFQNLDLKRDSIQVSMSNEELKPYSEKLSALRAKLLKCKIENEAFSKYVNITKDFIQGVIDNAVPQRRNKVYSKAGQIVQSKPQSIVVNQLF